MIQFKEKIKIYDLAGAAFERSYGRDGFISDEEDGVEQLNIEMKDGRQIDLGFSTETMEIIKEQ